MRFRTFTLVLTNVAFMLMIISVGFNSEYLVFGSSYTSKLTNNVEILNVNDRTTLNDDSNYVDNESILPKTVDESIGNVFNVITSKGLFEGNAFFPNPNQVYLDDSKEVPDTSKMQDKTSLTETSNEYLEKNNALIIQRNNDDYLLKLVQKPDKIYTNDVFVGDKNEILVQAENICNYNGIDVSLCSEKVNNALDALDFTEAIMGESKIRLDFDTVSMDIFSSPL